MPRVQSQTAIVDEGDSINLTCTYQSNCKGVAIWTRHKSGLSKLITDEEKRLGNNTISLTYILKIAEKHFARKPYFCFLRLSRKYIRVKLEVKGKDVKDKYQLFLIIYILYI
jgi:hypothetical protein